MSVWSKSCVAKDLLAWIVLGIWFGMQILGGFGSVNESGGVAYWAHSGGFAAGLLLILPLWLKLGGPKFWARTHGAPPHPEATYEAIESRIPRIKRR